MDNDKIGLSRRKMLVGLGAVGVASAGAGLGTTAFFSDEESFQDNTITAGQFELHATQTIYTVDQDGGPDEVDFNEMAGDDGFVEGILDIADAKPGDSYKVCWEPCVKYNPGYVRIEIDADESTGNDNGVGHVDASGTLGEYMLAVVTVTGQDGEDVIVFAGTLGELVDGFGPGGLNLVHSTAEADETGFEVEDSAEYCHDPCELMDSAPESVEEADPVEVCVDLYLPSGADVGGTVMVGGVEFDVEADDSPGNLVQGASFEADIVFEAEQCRHNDDPFQNDVEEENGDDDDDEDDDHDDRDEHVENGTADPETA